MTIYNTSSLPPYRVKTIKFSIRAEFLDTKLVVFTFPKASQANTSTLIDYCKNYNYGNFDNLNPRAIVGTARRKEHCVATSLVLINT